MLVWSLLFDDFQKWDAETGLRGTAHVRCAGSFTLVVRLGPQGEGKPSFPAQ